MPDAQTFQRLREHQDCIVLCRYIVKQFESLQSRFLLSLIDRVSEEPPGVYFEQHWISFAEDIDPEALGYGAGIVDIRNHRREVLYRNEKLEKFWTLPRRLKDQALISTYGVTLQI